MFIPQLVLKQLYTFGSLKNTPNGIKFSLKNRLADAKITLVKKIYIDDRELALTDVMIDEGQKTIPVLDISKDHPLEFPLRKSLDIYAKTPQLDAGKHRIRINFSATPFGSLELKVDGSISEEQPDTVKIPRDNVDDYSDDIIKKRQKFLEEFTGKKYEHLMCFNYDPQLTRGNIENFTGTIQIPMGLAGPITINGEHAKGDFLVPMATTEGTLVASYNRGIKVMNLSGGVKATVVNDAMQRAPVFVFKDARGARDFRNWINDHMSKIRIEAESTSSVAKLQYIDIYLSNKFAYLRFNYFTGDAAGQNMVGRATFAACSWIIDTYDGQSIQNFYLESNLATDKKASQINMMHSRGKRVIAEALIDRKILIQHMRVEPEKLNYHANISNIGAFISGANNNGAHSPNAITAMFIATGQDVANVAESSAGILYTELTQEGNLYISLTLPSLIVATYGGGTGLPSQREALEIMDCYGKNKVNKLAEIIGCVALAGEISLGSAISSSDWVSSHESYGRNR
jgi:hydroxymethylglutaryl-CoA reductase (NADPH)